MYELTWKGKEIAKEKANIPTETEFKIIIENMLKLRAKIDSLKDFVTKLSKDLFL